VVFALVFLPCTLPGRLLALEILLEEFVERLLAAQGAPDVGGVLAAWIRNNLGEF